MMVGVTAAREEEPMATVEMESSKEDFEGAAGALPLGSASGACETVSVRCGTGPNELPTSCADGFEFAAWAPRPTVSSAASTKRAPAVTTRETKIPVR